jgi:putative intracellular protease/amidase
LGWPVGFWAPERIPAWHEFTEAGYDTVIASPRGGRAEPDARSDSRDPSGYSAEDVLRLALRLSPACAALLEEMPAISTFRPESFDALDVAGGQSPMPGDS